MKSKKIIIHCGYPKSASATIVNEMIKIVKNYNVVNVNEDPELLNTFEEILNLDESTYKKKKIKANFQRHK